MNLTRSLVVAGLLMTTLLAHAGGVVVAAGCRTNARTGKTHCNSAPVVRVATPLGARGAGPRAKLVTRVPMAGPKHGGAPAATPALRGQGCFHNARGRSYTLMPNGGKRFGPC